jgi:hypothetical protein
MLVRACAPEVSTSPETGTSSRVTGVSEWLTGRCDEATATQAAVEVQLPSGGAFGTVCRLVAAGVAGRHDVTVDRIDELQLAIDAALRQPAAGDAVSLRITPCEGELRFEVGPFATHAMDTGALDRVLSTLVAGASTRGFERQTWIDMRVPLSSERG